ncbi:hypothetical protein D9M68_175120 [compost metagenome]
MIDGDELAEAAGQVVGLDGDLRRTLGAHPRRDHQRVVAGTPGFRQQRDERRFQRVAAGLRADLGRAAGGQHAAGVHRHQVVEALGLLHVGGGDDHAHARAAGADALDQLPELVARQRVDAGGRLVEDQQVGVVDQRAAQAELLFHAAGQLAGRALGEGREAGGVEQLGDAPAALGLVVAEQAGEEVDVLEHRERRVEVLAEALRHVGDARADAPPVAGVAHVAAEHLDLAGLDDPRAGDQRQQAGLADAVRADQPDHAVGGNLQADRVDRAGLAIAQAHAIQACRHGVHCGTLICSSAGQAASGSRRR